MSLQGYLLGLKLSVLFAFSAWAGVVLYIDPETAGIFGRSLFFMTLFLWLSGALTLMMTWFQKKIFNDERAADSLGSNMRRSVWISCLLLALLVFQYFKFFAFWNGLLIVTTFLLIELYFVHHTVKKGDLHDSLSASKHQHSRLKRKGLIRV